MLDHCKEEEKCCWDSGGEDCFCIVDVLWDAGLLFFKAAEDKDGPEALGVDGAVIVGPTGIFASLWVTDTCPGTEPFRLFWKEEVDDAAPKEERRELALLPPEILCLVDIMRVCN